MSPKEHDGDGDVDDRPRDKQRRSKSERKPDRDRPHRSSKSARSSKIGEGSDVQSLASSTKRHRQRKDADREKDREKDRDKDRDKDADRNRDYLPSRSASMADLGAADAPSKLAFAKDRISLPYPSFSKVHSKEAIKSRDDVSSSLAKRSIPLTPEPTDVGDAEPGSKAGGEVPHRSPLSSSSSSSSKKTSRPPTPPETDVSADKKQHAEDPEQQRSTVSGGVSRSASRVADNSKASRRSASSSQATYVKSPTNKVYVYDKVRSPMSRSASSASRQTTKRSASARSLKSKGKRDPLHVDSSPSRTQDSSPKTPTQSHQFPSHLYDDRKRAEPPTSAPDDYASTIASGTTTTTATTTATPATRAPSHPPPPIPPPPPPPAVDVHEVPRVDYLLQNGGLANPVSKQFLSVLPRHNGPCPPNAGLSGADALFVPFLNLLDQYASVLSKQGSIAVATGHRSVARRLLDRLENVFSRDLPPHGCTCIICEKSDEVHRGLNWGDVLEWVSGRIELPQWPPFDLGEIGTKAAEISGETPPRPASPVQLDPDIAEEFREHYLRQSKKVRSAVDRWLGGTGVSPVPPPQEVDDETLSFAILTNLDVKDRPYFNALLSGSRELRPAIRAPTPLHRPRTDLLVKTCLSLQRLYRLPQVPRDAECATYLIRNPHTHDLLITLSSINSSEWEILTSGRFDGFLWSGADVDDLASGAEPRGTTPFRGPSVMGSRNTTPFSPYSRGATPASFISLASSGTAAGRPPVSNDEEMEMAAIAEIEREIYTGMEALEDAFEKLHTQAEVVRTALRQRGAGLMQKLQTRRHIDVLPGSGNSQNPGYERPAWAAGSEGEGASDSEWGFDDMDIMPDDSASNISSNRHRRPKRRVERRTPAPIEEDDEE